MWKEFESLTIYPVTLCYAWKYFHQMFPCRLPHVLKKNNKKKKHKIHICNIIKNKIEKLKSLKPLSQSINSLICFLFLSFFGVRGVLIEIEVLAGEEWWEMNNNDVLDLNHNLLMHSFLWDLWDIRFRLRIYGFFVWWLVSTWPLLVS